MKTYTVQVPRGVLPCQIDDFPAKVGDGDDQRDFHRSCKGSLRITPGDLSVSENELKHLRKHHKGVARRLVVVGERSPAKSKHSPKVAPKAGKGSKRGTKPPRTEPVGPPELLEPEAEPEPAKAPRGKSKAKAK